MGRLVISIRYVFITFQLKIREITVVLLMEVKTQYLNEVYLQQKLGKDYDSECIIQTKFNNPLVYFC